MVQEILSRKKYGVKLGNENPESRFMEIPHASLLTRGAITNSFCAKPIYHYYHVYSALVYLSPPPPL